MLFRVVSWIFVSGSSIHEFTRKNRTLLQEGVNARYLTLWGAPRLFVNGTRLLGLITLQGGAHGGTPYNLFAVNTHNAANFQLTLE